MIYRPIPGFSAPTFEYLYDKPYPDNKKVRVAGPFTVESLSPNRVLGVDENDELIDTLKENSGDYDEAQSFPQMILENLNTAGVQQTHKEDKINFTALTPWPGYLVCAEGRYQSGPRRMLSFDLASMESRFVSYKQRNANPYLSPHRFPILGPTINQNIKWRCKQEVTPSTDQDRWAGRPLARFFG